MRSKVNGVRSAELLPAATVAISLGFSDKRETVFVFTCVSPGRKQRRAPVQEQHKRRLEIEA